MMAQQKSEPLREPSDVLVDFAALSPSSRAALGHARALADEVGRDAVGVEHLLLGLFDSKSEGPTRRAMQDGGLSRQDLVQTLLRIDKAVPREAAPDAKPAQSLPLLTVHAGQVLEAAFQLRRVTASSQVRSRHLLEALARHPECDVPAAFPNLRAQFEVDTTAGQADEGTLDGVLGRIHRSFDEVPHVVLVGDARTTLEVARAYADGFGHAYASVDWPGRLLVDQGAAASGAGPARKVDDRGAPDPRLIVWPDVKDKRDALDRAQGMLGGPDRILFTSRSSEWGEFAANVIDLTSYFDASPPGRTGAFEGAAPRGAAPGAGDAGKRSDVPLISDGRARKDMLKRHRLAEVIARKLNRLRADLDEDPRASSFMMLLDGPWGAGKSTILDFVQEELHGSSEWVIVNYDAWRQSNVGPPWWGLLASLRSAVTQRSGLAKRLRIRVAEFWRLAPQTTQALVVITGVVLAAAGGLYGFGLWEKASTALSGTVAGALATFGVLSSAAAAVVAVWRHATWGSARGARVFQDTRADPMGDLAGHFRWLLKQAPGPVLFVVDDLDRCDQQYVVEFLDAVQTLMRNPHPGADRTSLFFLVAADGRWIRRSYEIAHKEFESTIKEPGRALGHLFLDKLFQVTVPVPALGEELRQEYLRRLLNTDSADAEPRAERVAELQARIRDSGSQQEVLRILQDNAGEREALAVSALERLHAPDIERRTEHVLEAYASLLDPNPRSIKRFLMAYNFTRDVRLLEGLAPSEDALARWTILALRWPELASLLSARPEAIEIADTDLHAGGEDTKLKTLLQLPMVEAVTHGLTANDVRAAAGCPTSFDGE